MGRIRPMKTLRLIFSGLALGLMAGCGSSTANAQARNKYLYDDAPVSVNYPNSWTILTNIAYDETFENPAWVAYHLTGTAHQPSPRPSIGYLTDNRTQTKVTETDYPSGYVFNNVHNIQGGVPPENIIAMYDAAYEAGFY